MHKKPKNYVLLAIVFFIQAILFGQNNISEGELTKSLSKIDQKMVVWKNEEAISILEKLEEIKEGLKEEHKYAIELRRFQFRYYVENNDSDFNVVLNRLDRIKKMGAPQLEYDYLSFVAQVYKTSFSFDNAIKYHKKALSNAEKRKDTADIIYTCWSLGSSYYLIEFINKPEFHKNQIDSALYFYNKGLKFPENKKTITYLPRIYNNLGRIETIKENFKHSKSLISKALDLHKKNNDSFGISISLNNFSKVFLEEKAYNKSINLAIKSNKYIEDKSLRIKRNNLENIAKSYYRLGKMKKAYEIMQETLDVSEELTNHTFNNNVKKIEIKYKVAKERQNTLKEKNRRLRVQLLLFLTGALLIILSVFGFIFYSKNQKYKKRFKELIEKNKTINSIKKKDDVNLPLKTVNIILEGLEKFEKEKLFLKQNITLKDLAKKLKTNSSYLSKVVNKYKNKKFTTYVNELRIQYAIKELTNNAELRLYTIEAIAESMGFNNAESFALAFRKITGLYPSYFIKQLNKKSF